MPSHESPRPLITRSTWLWCALPLLLWSVLELSVEPITLFKQLNRTAQMLPDLFWVFFNMFGNGWGVFALLCPLLIIAPRALMATLCAGALAGVLSRTLKLSLQFPRPASVLDPASFHIIGNPLTSLSMPSGHTLTAFAQPWRASPASRWAHIGQPMFLLACRSGFSVVCLVQPSRNVYRRIDSHHTLGRFA